ncbi:MAG: DUF1932 domain-containing protein [Gammaproteobacteria bacterium]|nr:DUF1932 domain-containing protein [Gammaproteobacteria bacterium]
MTPAAVKTIGILGTGDMGSAVAAMLGRAGYRTVTALDGRSQASRGLAAHAGLEDLGSLPDLLPQCDLFLSILPPAAALEFAEEAAAIIARQKLSLVFADCNAVAPQTLARIAERFADSPAAFVDVGIVGPAPKPATPSPTRFYVSGPERGVLLGLDVPEFKPIDLGGEIGRASALKMCYAALNKGVDALYATILLAARRLDVDAELLEEYAGSQAEALQRMHRRLPFMFATAERFSGEMAEIAATFDAAGVSGDFHRGAEWLYALLARSELASETRATQPKDRSLGDALDAFARVIDDIEDR